MRRLLLLPLILPAIAYGQESEQRMPDLNAYRDYHTEAADFSLSFLRYRYRGYDPKYSELYINGVAQNSLLTGTPSWGALGSFTSLLSQGANGLSTAVGGGEWFATTGAQPGGRAVAAVSNRTYSYRASAGYNLTTKNGWAINTDVSRRFGRSMLVDGVFSDAWGVYLSVDKRVRRHRFTVTAMFAPSERATASPATREAFELAGSNLYNPAWGLQTGKKRSARVRGAMEPIVIANHSLDLGRDLTLNSVIAIRGGVNENSALMWQGAPNPLPDYYRYMPSMQKGQVGVMAVADMWRSDVNVRQINFDNLYYINSINGDRGKYMIENRVRRPLALTAGSAIRGSNFEAGITLRYDNERSFKTVSDLMGAAYWLDIDSYVEQDDDIKELTQNNLRDPNRHVAEGDRFGYDYALTAMQALAEGSYTFAKGNFKLTSAGKLGVRITQRRGFYEKENFPSGRSYGFSKPYSAIEYAVRLIGEYRLGTLFNFSASAGFENRPPTAGGVFIEPRYRNFIAPEASAEQVVNAEIVANYRTEKITARAAIHYAFFSHGTELRGMYDDMAAEYISYAMYDISRRHLGAELSAEFLLHGALYLNAALFIENNIYTSDAKATAYRESTGVVMRDRERVAYRGLHVPFSPQTAAVVAFTYRPYGWIVRLSASFFADNYVASAPLRRTFAAMSAAASPGALSDMTEQQKLPSGVTVDLFGGYTWRFAGSSLGIYAGVNNLLCDRSIISAGYESGRLRNIGTTYDRAVEPMPSKYYYAMPLNFFVNVTYRF